jgi:hypothetical protein
LGRDSFSEQVILALEIGFCVIDLGLRLLHASTGLVDLRLQRRRVNFRQKVSQLHLLADSERYCFQLSGISKDKLLTSAGPWENGERGSRLCDYHEGAKSVRTICNGRSLPTSALAGICRPMRFTRLPDSTETEKC